MVYIAVLQQTHTYEPFVILICHYDLIQGNHSVFHLFVDEERYKNTDGLMEGVRDTNLQRHHKLVKFSYPGDPKKL